jgi:hypothetical protein
MADNTGKTTQDLRIRKLNVTAPSALASHFVQASVVDQGINLKNFCGEGGDGSFSWLIRLDTAASTVTTGGAPPTSDPFGIGYCFVNQTIASTQVAPVKVNITKATDGTWASDVIDKLYVPIYVHADPKNVVILPITKAHVKGVAVSTDGNCIGAFQPNAVSAPTSAGVCADQDYKECQRWQTAGSLGGFITLKEADGVFVADLGKTLCVLLTNGTSVDQNGHCQKDASGNITAQGDFCSMTGAPAAAGCADSYWLAATFAASAAKINDGSADPACNGMGNTGGDGGAEAGAEAGSDSGGGEAGVDAAAESGAGDATTD